MDLSFIDKFLTTIKLPFQSFLSIEIFLIFILIFIFLIYNEKRKNRKVKISLIGLIIFFTCLLIFYFSNDILTVLTEIVRNIMRCFYFPNIIFYLITVIISLILLIYHIINTKITKKNKITTYALTLIHLLLFTYYISFAITNNIDLTDTANIYENNEMYVITLSSQIIFIILIIYKLTYHFCYIRREKLKNK